MSGLDIEGVLAGHWPIPVFGCECTPVDDESGEKAVLETSWEVHVAAVLREQIAAWLTAEGKREMHERGGHWHTVTASDVHVARKLDALAAQVACVDPSRSESGSTDPEVRQSADRTSAPSRVPEEGS